MAEHVVESIKRGDITGMSFGFRIKRQEWDETDENNPLRTILNVDLIEVSPVVFPAYPQTDVSARAAYDEWRSANQRQKPPLDLARYRYARILARQIA
jgi:HK97 family phage prohead protease